MTLKSLLIDLSHCIKIKILYPLLVFRSIFDNSEWDDAYFLFPYKQYILKFH